MSNAPYDYDYMNSLYGMITPSSVHTLDNQTAMYYRKYLLQKAMSVFEFELPANWSREYFLYTLFGIGFMAVIKTNKFGTIPQHCSLTGRNVFYEPRKAIISNPLIKGGIKDPVIGETCTIIRLQPNYSSIMDIVDKHAELMAIAWQTAMMNLINSKVSYVAFASDKSEAESFKAIHDDILSGNPSVVIDSSLKRGKSGNASSPNWQLFDQNVGANFIVDKLLDALTTIENKFKTEVGIDNANTDKKERLITAEVESNNQEIDSLASLWLKQLEQTFEKTREMFGYSDSELSVKLKKPKTEEPQEAGADYE